MKSKRRASIMRIKARLWVGFSGGESENVGVTEVSVRRVSRNPEVNK